MNSKAVIVDYSEEFYNRCIIRCLDGSASEIEAEHLLSWIQEKPEHLKLFVDIRDLWETTGVGAKQDIDTEQALCRFKEKNRIASGRHLKNSRGSGFTGKTMLRIAATVALILASGLLISIFVTRFKTENQVAYNKVVIPYGQKGQIVLTDGTTVWLNSGSELRYPSNFGSTSREVYLHGEAYFDVKRKVLQPFQVHTGEVMVKVLGTSFNLKSYPEEDIIEATLIKGSIKLYKDDGETSVALATLKPNEQAVYKPEKQEIDIAVLEYEEVITNKRQKKSLSVAANQGPLPIKPHIETVIQWKDQKLIFENESLAGMVVKLERWYGKPIQIADEELKSDKYTGKFEYNESIYQVLDVLCHSTNNMTYYEKDHIIYIKRK